MDYNSLTNKNTYLVTVILIIFTTLFQNFCKLEEEKYSISGKTMGTTYNVSILGIDKDEGLQSLLEEELNRLENVFSTYKIDSEITRFNNHYAIGKFFSLSPEFLEVWDIAETIQKDSEGAFSPSIGRIVEGWGFGASNNKSPLPKESLAIINDCKDSIWMERVDGGLIPRDKKGLPSDCNNLKNRIKLDLSGVAKGYAVDRIMDILRQNGIDTAMVEIGGDLCVRSSSHKPYLWKIGIKNLKTWGISRSINLQLGCVATSGNAHQKLHWEGKNYTHIIDPRSGYPINTNLSSVTVVIRNGSRPGAYSDAWATALFVLGEESIPKFEEKFGFQVYLTNAK